MIRTTLVGRSGKMGQAVEQLIDKDPSLIVDQTRGDVVVDFSSPEGTIKAIGMGLPLVCGTTGLPPEVREKLTQLSKTVPVLYAPNFSVGVALTLQCLEMATGFTGEGIDITIEETHRADKKDTPSGTAIHMAETIGISRENITSHRVGDAKGKHTIYLDFGLERVTIEQEALSREAYAAGALKAVKYIVDRPAGFYSLSDLFLLKTSP